MPRIDLNSQDANSSTGDSELKLTLLSSFVFDTSKTGLPYDYKSCHPDLNYLIPDFEETLLRRFAPKRIT